MLDHLEYLRLRLIRAGVAYLLATIVSYFFVGDLMSHLVKEEAGLTGLVFLSPAEAFFARLKMAFAMGLVLGLPVILYQIWALFAPGLAPRQKRGTLLLIPAAYLLFLGGCAFAFFGVLPLALRFFLSFGGEGLQQEISIANYVSFLIGFILPFGVIFELPIAIVILARIGILRHKTLREKRKYAIFLIFVVAAVMTPADLFSQFMMAIPLLILYELSILLARLVAPKQPEDSAGGV